MQRWRRWPRGRRPDRQDPRRYLEPITEDFKGLRIGHTTSAAEEIEKLAPQAKAVKAYNTIFAQLLPAEARAGRAPVQVFDDQAAKKVLSDVVAKGGFEPIDSGPLSNARYLERPLAK